MSLLKEQILNMQLTDSQLGIFYTGQVGFILKYHNKTILIDGYLTNYVDRHCCTDTVKWIRKYPAPIHPEELDFIDYVFCTHAHYDHADPDTLRTIASVNNSAQFYVPQSVKPVISGYGIAADRICGVICDREYSLDSELSFTAVPSAHEELHPDYCGGFDEVGYKFTFGDTILYHSGDCCMYDGLTERIRNADIVILPINGRDYFRNKNDIIGCFDCGEAITLAQNAGASLMIPVHYDLYSVNEVNPAYFVDCLMKINPAQRFHMFVPGEAYIWNPCYRSDLRLEL